MQLLDCEVAQMHYDERLRKAEKSLRLRYAHVSADGQASMIGISGLVNQFQRWIGARPHQQVSGAHRPRHV